MTDRLQTELAETTNETPDIKRDYFPWKADPTQRFILSYPDSKMVWIRFSGYFGGVLIQCRFRSADRTVTGRR